MDRTEKRRREKAARKANGKATVARPFGDSDGSLPEGLIADLTAQAVQLHVAGMLADAQAIYHRILEMEPDNADANHLLGGLACQAGNPEQAIGLITKAIAKDPGQALFHFNLGNVYQSLGRLEEAARSSRAALALKPDYPEAMFALGNALQGLGALDEAVMRYGEILKAAPDNAMTHNNLGAALQGLGRRGEAITCFQRAIALNPGHGEAHGNLGKAFLEMGRMEEAVSCNRQALALDPSLIEAHNNLGNALQELGRLDEAVAAYRQAIALKPDFAEAYSNLGNVLQGLGRLDDAVEACRTAIALKPGVAEMHGNLGTAAQRRGDMEEALDNYVRAITLKPDYAIAWNNLNSAAKAAQYVDGRIVADDGQRLAGLDDATRAGSAFALHGYYRAAFRPHLADDAFNGALAALPARAHEVDVIDGVDGAPDLAENMIALLHFGRSGTGLLHSLIDGHPQISTLPSIYLRGYFNEGVWKILNAGGRPELPARFCEMFEVLFDAASARITPGILEEKNTYLGVKEGMTTVGENRDQTLTLDRDAFCAEAHRLMAGVARIDAMSFLRVVHGAYDAVLGAARPKGTLFYHIHNPENFTKLNFLRHAPDARLVMMVREPLQCCESWLRVPFGDNDHGQVADHIIKMLYGFDQVPFRARDSVGVRLEDLKSRPRETLAALCAWMGVGDDPCLYEMTAQGQTWWGDPSSPDFGRDKSLTPFGDEAVKRPVGAIFSPSDQLVLGALFHPFSVRFGYCEADPADFERHLREIRPRLDRLFDFEVVMAERAERDHDAFKATGSYRLLRAALLDRWAVLNELGDYPHMLAPLAVS